MRKIISLLIRICISTGVLFFLFKRVDVNKIIQAISGANKPILTLVLLLIFLIYFIGFLRWKMLLTGLGLNLPQIQFEASTKICAVRDEREAVEWES